MTELILIRHGETDWNRELRFQGQLDVALNATGLEQARRVAQRLASEGLHALVSSDLQRALQTAQALADVTAMGAPLRDVALREQGFGVVEGWTVAEIKERLPEAWDRWVRFDEHERFEGGESLRELHDRVLAALQAVAARHAGQRVAVVTHGGVLDMIYRHAQGLSLSGPRTCSIPNGGINRVVAGPEGLRISDWADVRHLDGLGPQPVYDQVGLARRKTLKPAG